MSVLAFVFMFSKMWKRWRDSPVIIAMDERQRAVWDIPFPAITVCPKTKMRATLFNFSQAYDRVKNGQSDPHELSVFEDLSLLCDTSIIANGTDFRNISTIQRIEEFPSLKKLFKLSTRGIEMDSRWRFLLHAPHEFPRTAEKAFLAPLDSVMQVSVLPSEVLTSPDMKRYTVQQRQCYFPEERRLAFFQHYTQNNCQVECLANVTLSMCECVAYYMPQIKNGKNGEVF
ncbi:Pickpocket protein 11 [Gryllus bimaculatus]|nr:Pickpocket protein 11 [Gryllus bimaculatus]